MTLKEKAEAALEEAFTDHVKHLFEVLEVSDNGRERFILGMRHLLSRYTEARESIKSVIQ